MVTALNLNVQIAGATDPLAFQNSLDQCDFQGSCRAAIWEVLLRGFFGDVGD